MERVNYLAKRVVGLEEFKTLCRNEKVRAMIFSIATKCSESMPGTGGRG